MREDEKAKIKEEWEVFKCAVMGCVEVGGMIRMGGGVRKNSERWCEHLSVAIVEKKRACGVWLQWKGHMRDTGRRKLKLKGLFMIQK